MVFALVGNQNCGKTTLFNQLTGSNQHVGNFPGVTVDSKSGAVRGLKDCTVVDLPGIYSMRPYTSEEIVTRDFIINQKPDAILNIVDATNIERNLYLTLQLLSMKIPMVLALNMMDEVRNNGGTIDIDGLSKNLGIPVVPISASKNEGIAELISKMEKTAKNRVMPAVTDFCESGPIHRCIHAVCHVIEDHAQNAGVSSRFAATKLIEGDEPIKEKLGLDENELDLIGHSIAEMETEHGMDRYAAIADMRYTFIEKVCADTVVKSHESKEHIRSVKIDKVLTHKIFAIPIFIGIMLLVFFLSFDVIGAFLSDLLSRGIDSLTALVANGLDSYGINPVVKSLIVDGVFAGVGSVLSFLPIVVVLFFFLSILEDSGYMARIAFVMDKLLRKIGLSGRSIVPMLIGFGCSVPAIMSARTLSSERDRKMTIMLTPFMSCSAKLPVYGLMAGAFFAKGRALVILSLYLIGIIVGILSGYLFRKTIFKDNDAAFMIELPTYRLPAAKNVFTHVWERVSHFIEKAGTIIFAMSVVLWFLQSFDLSFNMVQSAETSILGRLGSFIAPVFSPMGYGCWQAAVALLTGIIAKEAVVSSLAMFCGFSISAGGGAVQSALSGIFTPRSAYAFLVFVLLYTPCMAAVATIRRELGSRKWTAFAVCYQILIAYVMSFVVYTVCGLFMV